MPFKTIQSPTKKTIEWRLYYANNKDKVDARRRLRTQSLPRSVYLQAVTKGKPLLKHRVATYKIILHALYRKHQDKPYKSIGDITSKEFRLYIELQFSDGMSWDNYGKLWHIDHIIPLSQFDLSKRSERIRASYFENLRPLLCAINTAQGAPVLKQRQQEALMAYYSHLDPTPATSLPQANQNAP